MPFTYSSSTNLKTADYYYWCNTDNSNCDISWGNTFKITIEDICGSYCTPTITGITQSSYSFESIKPAVLTVLSNYASTTNSI